jgi:YVTN family beta-propeller protein
MTSFAGTDLHRGAELAGYRIEALLGRGGMGVVYLAEQLRLKRRVALKLLAPELAADQRFRARFLRESELAASLDHPNVVPIFDAGEAEGLLYIAMRYVEGTDLGTLLAQEGRLEPERAIAIVGAVAAGLDAAHARGLVHRDVKPGNVLLAEDGTVYLADFGLTRSAGESGPAEKPHLSGTPEYVAPEQIQHGEVGGSADVYSLGCVLFECLAGESPFAGSSPMSLLFAHLEKPPPSLTKQRPELPAAIDAVIATALAKEPAERYPSCGELAGAAAVALGVGLPRPRISRRKLLLLASLGALLVAIAAAVPSVLLTRGESDSAKPTTVITRDTLQRIDPDTNTLVASIPYGQTAVEANLRGSFGAGPVAVGEGAVWVFGPRAQVVLRIDPETDSITGQSAVSLADADLYWETFALAAAYGQVWAVTNTEVVTVVDPGTTVTADQIPIPGVKECFHLKAVFDSVFVWCASGTNQPVSAWRIDPATGTPVRVLEFGDGEFHFTAQPGDPPGARVWFGQGETILAVFDLATAGRIADFRLPFAIGGFEARESPAGEPDGNTSGWVSNPEGDTVWRLDPFTGEVVARIPVGDAPTGIALGDGAVWVANSGDGTVSRIDPASETVVETITVGGHPQSIAVGEDGVWVTVYPAATAPAPTELAPGAEAATSELVPLGHTEPFERTSGEGNVAFSPDGRYAIVGSGALATPWLLDVATRQEVRQFEGHTADVRSVAFSPDGTSIATASYDGTARLWNVATGEALRVFEGHAGGVVDVAFSPDGRQMVTGSFDGTARLWNVETGEEVRQFHGHTDGLIGVAFSPDGKQVLTGSFDRTGRLWDSETGQELRSFPMPSEVVPQAWVAFSPDGKHALLGGDDNEARLWDVASGQPVRDFVGHTGGLQDMAFSADGQYAVTSSIDRTARLWDVATGRQLVVFAGHSEDVPGVAISPDDKLVLTSSRDGTVRVWKTGLDP